MRSMFDKVGNVGDILFRVLLFSKAGSIVLFIRCKPFFLFIGAKVEPRGPRDPAELNKL